MAKMNKSPSKCRFFGSIFFVLHVLTQADPPYNLCSSSPNFAVNSPFQSNLNNLLNNLQSNASISSFNYTTVGKDEDRIYGNFLCLLNVSPQDCQTCVKTAAQNIQKLCPSSKEAITWEENCQIRYSNRSFFGVLDKTGYEPLFNMKNISDPEKFTTTVKDLMGKLTEKAVSGNSTKMVATGQSNYSSIETLYGLVQCTPDLSQNDCKICLQTATNEILSCCYFYRGARVLLRSCYLRYEMYPFNEVKSSSPTQTASTPSTRARLSTALIVVISIVFIGVFVIGGISCYCFVKKRRPKADRSDLSNHIDSLHSVLSHRSQHGENQINPQEFIRFVDILRATNHFSDSNKLGEGGFGPVYKGRLPDGREVAIKRLSSNSEQGSEEFMNEVLLIMKLQHKNLVRLIGCCTEREERILVYEYMPNSSLDVLLAPSRRRHLDWRKRVSIIIGIARGLLYLHQDSRLKIIHRDLKASNVLLGHDLNPKISDFGMARIFLGNLGEASTNRIVGTYGYMAPEYAMEGAYSTKIDVYSFGVLLFEIITGKKSVGFHLSQIAPSLVAYVWRLWSEGYGLELKDQLLVEFDKVEFLRCIQIGLLCVQEDPAVRPNMSSVVVMLGSKSLVLPQPQQPAGLAARVGNKAEKCNKNSVNGLTISTITPR